MRGLRQGVLLIFSFLLLMSSVTAHALPPMNLPYGVTPVSHDIYRLHMAIFYICCVIGVVVFSVLIYALIHFRRSKGAEASKVDEHLGIEIIWTVIPFLILVVMAIPATKVLMKIHDTKQAELNIKVTGYQWKWEYEYLDQGIHFFSNLSTSLDEINGKKPKSQWFLIEVDNPLVLPIHKKVRFLVTANDVVHSWWVPELGVKQDAVPGYINENWAIIDRPGVYRGQCGELCGANHGFMPIVVKAVTQAEFDAWVKKHQKEKREKASAKSRKLTKKELLSLGKTAYDKSCAACHRPDGSGMPPTFPALKGDGIVTGPVSHHLKIILNGVSGTAMQSFANQLDDETLAAIVTYQRNAWGNGQLNESKHLPVVVQPSEVEAARGS